MIELNFVALFHQKQIIEIKVYQFKKSLMFLADYIYFKLDFHRKLAILKDEYLNIKYFSILFTNSIKLI